MFGREAAAALAGACIGAAAAAAPVADPVPGPVPTSSISVDVQEIASGDLLAPNLLMSPGDGSGRLFVTDQPGQVRVIQNGSLLATPFLDLSSDVVDLALSDERGLLGLAFHPGFADAASSGFGRMYTYHSAPLGGVADFTVPLVSQPTHDHQSVVSEWTLSDPASNVFSGTRRELLRIDQPQANHNAGALAFGPDDLLYIGLGDGGNFDDQGDGHTAGIGNGQDRGNVLGSMLRIDPLGNDSANSQYGIPTGNPFRGDPSTPDEIFASGLRNPFRFSFDTDPGTGDDILLVTDVGQNAIEEVNAIDPVTQAGANFGWPLKEGSFAFDMGGPGNDGFVDDDLSGLPGGLVDPIGQLDHDELEAIIGGFVYRGNDIPGLVGKYVFAAYANLAAGKAGRLFALDLASGAIEELVVPSGLPFVHGLGLDGNGELHVLTNDALFLTPLFGAQGRVFRLVPEPSAAGLAILGLAALAFRGRRGLGA